jgi:hypothetical protein
MSRRKGRATLKRGDKQIYICSDCLHGHDITVMVMSKSMDDHRGKIIKDYKNIAHSTQYDNVFLCGWNKMQMIDASGWMCEGLMGEVHYKT